MTEFHIVCDNCDHYISIINIDPGQDVTCRYCNNIQVVPDSERPKNEIICSNCSTIQYQDANYCHHCGESLTQGTRQSSNGKKRKNILSVMMYCMLTQRLYYPT